MSAGGASIDIIKTMFPDSDIAANMKLQRTKLTYTIVHGLARFFMTELIDIIKRVSCFTISFDESLNKIAEKEQLDVYIRFWDDNANEVSCRYYNSAFLGHTTSNDLLKALKMSLEPLDLQRLLQISMDGPNVNIKMFKDFKEELKSADDSSPIILDIGTCGIHTLHNSFKISIKSSSWNLVEFLRAIYNVFKHVPACRAEFIKITGSRKFSLKFCAVRWLNNICVAERADEMLSDLIKYVTTLKDMKKEPISFSYKVMSNCLKDKMIKPKLAFFKTIAAEIEPFLRRYQIDEPMGPYLFTDLSIILKSIMSRFITSEVLDNNILTKIDVFDKKYLKGVKLIDLGYMTRDAIRFTKNITDKEMLTFRTDCELIMKNILFQTYVKVSNKYLHFYNNFFMNNNNLFF